MNPGTEDTGSVSPSQPATPMTTSPPASAPGAIGALLSSGAQGLVRSQLSLGKEEAAWSLGNFARMARQAGTQLRQHEQEPVAQVTDRAAAQMEQASLYLHQTDLDHIVGDLEDFARRQPALFIAGGLVLGIVAARFIKSTAQSPQP